MCMPIIDVNWDTFMPTLHNDFFCWENQAYISWAWLCFPHCHLFATEIPVEHLNTRKTSWKIRKSWNVKITWETTLNKSDLCALMQVDFNTEMGLTNLRHAKEMWINLHWMWNSKTGSRDREKQNKKNGKKNAARICWTRKTSWDRSLCFRYATRF